MYLKEHPTVSQDLTGICSTQNPHLQSNVILKLILQDI